MGNFEETSQDENIIKSPTYLNTLLNKEEDIVFIYKIQEASEQSFNVSTTQKENNNVDTLDITGSPLKVEFMNESSLSGIEIPEYITNFWEKEEEEYIPYSPEEMKKFLINYWNKNYLNPKCDKPVWCLCDGSNDDKTLLMSALQTPSYISRSFVNYKGYFPSTDKLFTFDNFCDDFFKFIGEFTDEKKKISLKQLKSESSHTYELYGSKLHNNEINNSSVSGSVYLDIKWNLYGPEIPMDSAKCTMSVQSVLGRENSILYRFWHDLIQVELYMKLLVEWSKRSHATKKNDWLPSKENAQENLNLIDKIIETIENFQQFRSHKPTMDRTNLTKIIENVDNRHSFDITDHLWNLLNKCSRYGILIDSLNVVFTEIAQSDSKVFVSESSMSSMACIIRDLMSRKLAIFNLTDSQTIEIIIDTGLEKLQKDFVNIFTQFGIASECELNEIFSETFRKYYTNNDKLSISDISRNNIRTALYHKQSIIKYEYFEEKLTILGKMYTALELIMLIPDQWKTWSINSVYNHFFKNKDFECNSFATLAQQKLYEIQINLPVSEVREYIKTKTPIMRRFSLNIKRPLYSIQSVYHLSQRPIFPPNVFNPDSIDLINMNFDDVYYHFIKLINITNFIKIETKKN